MRLANELTFGAIALIQGVGVKSSLVLDFANNIYQRNGVLYPDLPTLLAAGGGSYSRAGSCYDLAATQLFAANTPRITVAGLLLESAATNLLVSSSEFDNASWIKDASITVAANTTAAPDGTTTADSLVSTSFFQKLLQNIPSLPNVAIVSSVWAKRIAGGLDLILQDTSGVGGTQTLSASWARYNLASTVSGGADNIQTFVAGGPAGTNGQWGAQTESAAAAGYFATNPSSLIPTGGASASRAADAFLVNVPSGKSTATLTYSDATTQNVAVTGGASWNVAAAVAAYVAANNHAPILRSITFS